MATPDDLDPDAYASRPPDVPTLVGCLLCRQQYESYCIEWRLGRDDEGKEKGFWCCPTPGCPGKGFWFDILPLDPDYEDERGSVVWLDEDDIDESEADDPRPPSDDSDDDEIPF